MPHKINHSLVLIQSFLMIKFQNQTNKYPTKPPNKTNKFYNCVYNLLVFKFAKQQQKTKKLQHKMQIMTIYYGINRFWIWFNLFVIVPFFIAFVFRVRNRSFDKKLWTDHLTRLGLGMTLVFYLADTIVKSYVDGTESICQKAIIIHHVASFFIILPLIVNSYIPWWVNPIGFIHGWIVFFDDHVNVQYVYGVMMLYFQFMLYQKPYRDLKGYWITRIAINFVWTFIIIYKVGDCSNYLPVESDRIGGVEEGLLI